MYIKKFSIKTDSHCQILNIDNELSEAIMDSNIKSGIATVFCPHTTAAITINENGDPDVLRDIVFGLNCISPNKKEYLHYEGNSDAHIKSSIIGASESIIIDDGKPIFGTWQSLYFCEFDGPRLRNFVISIK